MQLADLFEHFGTAREIAKAAGLPEAAVWQWERRHRIPRKWQERLRELGVKATKGEVPKLNFVYDDGEAKCRVAALVWSPSAKSPKIVYIKDGKNMVSFDTNNLKRQENAQD